MTGIKVIRYPNPEKLGKAAASFFSSHARKSITQSGRFLVAISGGSTPIEMYKQLSQATQRQSIPWRHTHVFWCDERLVPPDHPESNYHLANHLFLSKCNIPATNIHRIQGELPATQAAATYQQTLLAFSSGTGDVHFDLVVLGLGADGHTAALFPGPITPAEQNQSVLITQAHYQDRPAERISLTPLILNAAHQILFLVTGKEKAHAVANVLHGEIDLEKWPAQRVQPVSGQVTWLLDEDASSSLLDPNEVLIEHNP
jgi:6-phosphogluconolactonase